MTAYERSARPAEHGTMSDRYSTVVSRVRVPSGFVVAAIYLLFAEPTPLSLVSGSVVALAGLTLRAASAGHVQKNRRLTISGPYAYTRNPLYLGSAIGAMGLAAAGGRWWFFLMIALYFAAIYLPVMRREEKHLTSLFGNSYTRYATAVPLLLPRWTAWREAGGARSRFDADLYWLNREYRALLAFLVIVAVLWGKMVWMR
jgi:protein-S-isoprenylcysteine O-methyltransferase Ste14